VLDGPQGSELQQLRVSAPSTEPAIARAVSLIAVVAGWKPDAERWLLSVFKHCKADFEALVVDASGSEPIAGWLATRAAERLRVITVDPTAGFAAAANAAIESAAGEVCVLFDTSIELTGDAIAPLLAALDDPAVVVAGPFGLRAEAGMKEFKETSDREADAIEGYCLAFRRSDALAAGGLDPKFRFYRISDIDLSFRLRDHGGRAVVVGGLPLERHDHRVWESTPQAERERLSRRNLYRFLDRWRFRTDLLVGGPPTRQ
jgi:GT2 family glycosyltransferase